MRQFRAQFIHSCFYTFQFETSNLGQRNGLSEKDITKINSMYSEECNNDTVSVLEMHQQMIQQQQEVAPVQVNYIDSIIKWFESLIGLEYLWNKKRI